eukprot:scaffold3183_cov381-Prasinococcus_capsulatus_cf.AAC.28
MPAANVRGRLARGRSRRQALHQRIAGAPDDARDHCLCNHWALLELAAICVPRTPHRVPGQGAQPQNHGLQHVWAGHFTLWLWPCLRSRERAAPSPTHPKLRRLLREGLQTGPRPPYAQRNERLTEGHKRCRARCPRPPPDCPRYVCAKHRRGSDNKYRIARLRPPGAERPRQGRRAAPCGRCLVMRGPARLGGVACTEQGAHDGLEGQTHREGGTALAMECSRPLSPSLSL